jgi:hypothetical protein
MRVKGGYLVEKSIEELASAALNTAFHLHQDIGPGLCLRIMQNELCTIEICKIRLCLHSDNNAIKNRCFVIPAQAGIHHLSWSFTSNSLSLTASGDGFPPARE